LFNFIKINHFDGLDFGILYVETLGFSRSFVDRCALFNRAVCTRHQISRAKALFLGRY